MAYKDEYGETALEDAKEYGLEEEDQNPNPEGKDNKDLIAKKLQPGTVPAQGAGHTITTKEM
ncbi:MAG: hypothetical protein Q8O88_01350 [bacterium]|nr:hypothetical protein [bacterium]